jgi:hypothetical protein
MPERVKFSLRLSSSNTTNLLLRRSGLAVSYSKLRSSPSLVTVCLARRWPCLVQVAAVHPRSMELSSITDAFCSGKRMSLGGWVGRKAGLKLRHHTYLFPSQPLPTSSLPQIYPKTLITPQHLRLIRYDADHHLCASIRQLRENAITSPSLTRISIPGFAVMNLMKRKVTITRPTDRRSVREVGGMIFSYL